MERLKVVVPELRLAVELEFTFQYGEIKSSD